MIRKLSISILVTLFAICCGVMPVFADNGNTNVNLTFIIMVCIFIPLLVGVIIYYAIRARKYRKMLTDEKEKTKVVRIYDSEDK